MWPVHVLTGRPARGLWMPRDRSHCCESRDAQRGRKHVHLPKLMQTASTALHHLFQLWGAKTQDSLDRDQPQQKKHPGKSKAWGLWLWLYCGEVWSPQWGGQTQQSIFLRALQEVESEIESALANPKATGVHSWGPASPQNRTNCYVCDRPLNGISVQEHCQRRWPRWNCSRIPKRRQFQWSPTTCGSTTAISWSKPTAW